MVDRAPPAHACIGLGGNLGDVSTNLARAFAALDALPRTRLLRRSAIYRTPAWGVSAQPDFLNAAALVATRLPARELLGELLRIERDAGRDRLGEAPRWGPRTLDLDLLLYGDSTLDEPGLRVPHPHLHERAFVLVPLAEIAPSMQVPALGTIGSLRDRLDVSAIVRVEDA